jgi:hypothetical protein
VGVVPVKARKRLDSWPVPLNPVRRATSLIVRFDPDSNRLDSEMRQCKT